MWREAINRRCLVVCGLPGTGKSTVIAKLQAIYTGASTLETDRLWIELYPCPSYSISESDIVFAELLSRLRASPAPLVIVEGVFASLARVTAVCCVAATQGARPFVCLLTCSRQVALMRLSTRQRGRAPFPTERWNWLSHRLAWGDLADLTVDTSLRPPGETAFLVASSLEALAKAQAPPSALRAR